MTRRFPLAAVLVVWMLFGGVRLLAADAPVVFQYEGRDLAGGKAKYQAGDKAISKTVKEICEAADKALTLTPPSVAEKEPTPPTGDKHDYMSLSPYWWPDPSKPDGKPYIRRDGEYNPERAKYDVDRLDKLSNAVGDLSLAYYLTGNEAYAAKAAELMRVWFIDPKTKMNPNLKYSQFVPGGPEWRASGVIEGNRLRNVVDADGLLKGSKAWTEADSSALKAWFRELLTYLLESPQGKAESEQPNNHGTWYGVQTITYALFLGDEELARKLLDQHGPKRIASQIEPDGRQPYELERTRAFDYSRFNILAHVELAMLGERLGVNLWNYQTEDGRSLRKAIDWLIPFATGEKSWEYKQITPIKVKEAALVFRRAANGMNEPRYEQLISKLKGGEGLPKNADLMFPPKN